MNGIGDFISSTKEIKRLAAQVMAELKGDLPGHEFHGNQYADGGGSSGGDGSDSGDYPSKQEDYFDDNYSPSFTAPEAKAGDSKEKVKRVAINLVSHARSDVTGGDAWAATQDQSNFIEGWAKRAFADAPFSVNAKKSSGSKYQISVRRIRKTYQ